MRADDISQHTSFESRSPDDTSAGAYITSHEIVGQPSRAFEEATGADGNTSQSQALSDEEFAPAAVPITLLRTAQPQREKVTLLREWEGVVEDVVDRQIVARLYDSETKQRELIEFSIDSVTRDDWSLVKQGAVFYWLIGRRTDEYGSVENFSEIRFRRLPAWTEREIREAKRQGEKMLSEFFG